MFLKCQSPAEDCDDTTHFSSALSLAGCRHYFELFPDHSIYAKIMALWRRTSKINAVTGWSNCTVAERRKRDKRKPEEANTHKSAKTHAGIVSATRNFDLWRFDIKINGFPGLLSEHFYVCLCVLVFEISRGQNRQTHRQTEFKTLPPPPTAVGGGENHSEKHESFSFVRITLDVRRMRQTCSKKIHNFITERANFHPDRCNNSSCESRKVELRVNAIPTVCHILWTVRPVNSRPVNSPRWMVLRWNVLRWIVRTPKNLQLSQTNREVLCVKAIVLSTKRSDPRDELVISLEHLRPSKWRDKRPKFRLENKSLRWKCRHFRRYSNSIITQRRISPRYLFAQNQLDSFHRLDNIGLLQTDIGPYTGWDRSCWPNGDQVVIPGARPSENIRQ